MAVMIAFSKQRLDLVYQCFAQAVSIFSLPFASLVMAVFRKVVHLVSKSIQKNKASNWN